MLIGFDPSYYGMKEGEQIGPGAYRFRRTNYAPQRNLSVLILTLLGGSD